LSVVTWIPRGNKDDDTEKNGFISPDFNSYTTDLSGIYHIITVDDKSTWVNDWSKKVTRQINIDNDNITTTKQISMLYK
jgi:predicted xylose isomerase-like sugar epimerase